MTDASSFKLVIEDDEGRRSVVPVDLGEVSIGRLDGNTIRLNERNVSRRHARLFRQAANVVAEDLDSYNGVFINGERIKGQHEVRSGDVLRIGDFQLELRGEGLAGRAEETTQRTQMPDVEATRPDIRLTDGAAAPRAAVAVEAPVEEPKPREEPTAIIRMSHLEDVEASRREGKSAISGQKAKLVCVSTQFAGRQFEISKTEVVIGRTDENDIAVDHRSVSRHHAKLITSGKSVKLIDLKSANGTLVNGEEYAQTDLKNGDLIEFGHVKFRFVPAGETYNFSPEELSAIEKGGAEVTAGATLPDRPTASGAVSSVLKTHQLVLAAIVGLAVVVGILVVWLIATSGDKPKPQTTTPEAIEPSAMSPVAPAAGSEAERMLSRAQVAYAQRQWQQAVDLARAVAALEAGNQGALDLVSRATGEQKAQAAYDMAVSAINGSQWEQAWGYLQQIPDNSVYAAQAGPLTKQVQAALITDKLQQASMAAEDRDWARAEVLVQEVRSIDASRPEAVGLLAQIDAGRREDRDRPSRPPSRGTSSKASKPPASVPDKPAPPPTPPPAAPEPAAPAADPKALYNKGAEHLKANQFPAAIDKFSECIKVDKKNCACFRAMGITFARAGNGPKAYRYYKQYLKVCPDAPDSAAVTELLKQYEAQQ